MHGPFLSPWSGGVDPLAGGLETLPYRSLPGARHDAARPASLPKEKGSLLATNRLRVHPH